MISGPTESYPPRYDSLTETEDEDEDGYDQWAQFGTDRDGDDGEPGGGTSIYDLPTGPETYEDGSIVYVEEV